MRTEEERKALVREANQRYKMDGRQPCVYAITNKLTGEQYVGCQVAEIRARIVD